MSSILDALKKSEAERQRGLPPTIGSSLPLRRRPQPKRLTRLWLPVAAIGAIALAWASGLFDFGDNSTPAEFSNVENGSAASIEAPVEPPISAPPTEAATSPQTTAAAPAERQEPAIRRGFGPNRPIVSNPPSVSRPAFPPASADASAEETSRAPPPVEEAIDAANETAQTDTRLATAPTPLPASDAMASPKAEARDATPVAAEPAASAVTSPDGIPTIHELPFAARRTLPEITVTMHMFSNDPERRFALINGVRARDGQALEGGVEVVRVLPDGVQLRFESTEFILPVSN